VQGAGAVAWERALGGGEVQGMSHNVRGPGGGAGSRGVGG